MLKGTVDRRKKANKGKAMARRRQSSFMQPDRGINSLQEALEQVDVHALKFVFLTRHWPSKLLWLVVFLGGLAISAYYIKEIVTKYSLRQTATKITTKINAEGYDYPPMYLCPRQMWDLEKSERAGLSRDAITYAAWLVQRNESKHILPSIETDKVRAQEELHTFIHKTFRNRTYAEFYKWIATDFHTVVDKNSSTEAVDYAPIFVTSQFQVNKLPEHGPCYNVSVGKYDPYAGRPLYIMYNFDKGVSPYGFERDFIVIKDDHKIVLEKDRIYLRKNRHTAVRVSVKEYSRIASGTNGCKKPGGGYSQSYCRFGCLVKAVKDCSLCTLMKNDTEPIGHNLLCTWAENEELVTACGDSSYFRGTYDRCLRDCQPLCEYKSYDVSTAMVVLNPDEWNDTRVALSIDLAVDDGIIAFEEIPLYDLENMVSNVGGLLGLWTGASLLTVVEVVYLLAQFFCANWKLRKEEQRRRRAESIRIAVGNRSPSLTADKKEHDATPISDVEENEEGEQKRDEEGNEPPESNQKKTSAHQTLLPPKVTVEQETESQPVRKRTV